MAPLQWWDWKGTPGNCSLWLSDQALLANVHYDFWYWYWLWFLILMIVRPDTLGKRSLWFLILIMISDTDDCPTRHSWQMAPMLSPRNSVASQATSCLAGADHILFHLTSLIKTHHFHSIDTLPRIPQVFPLSPVPWKDQIHLKFFAALYPHTLVTYWPSFQPTESPPDQTKPTWSTLPGLPSWPHLNKAFLAMNEIWYPLWKRYPTLPPPLPRMVCQVYCCRMPKAIGLLHFHFLGGKGQATRTREPQYCTESGQSNCQRKKQ